MKINIHSFTDLITNSSTTIFTYSDNSLEACREMIDEFFKALGVDKKCDDVFNLVVTMDSYSYTEYMDDEEEDDEEDEDEGSEEEEEESVDEKSIAKTVKDVQEGKIAKPKWMADAEEYAKSTDEPSETFLHISAKSPEFEKLAQLVSTFLYSTEQEASYG